MNVKLQGHREVGAPQRLQHFGATKPQTTIIPQQRDTATFHSTAAAAAKPSYNPVVAMISAAIGAVLAPFTGGLSLLLAGGAIPGLNQQLAKMFGGGGAGSAAKADAGQATVSNDTDADADDVIDTESDEPAKVTSRPVTSTKTAVERPAGFGLSTYQRDPYENFATEESTLEDFIQNNMGLDLSSVGDSDTQQKLVEELHKSFKRELGNDKVKKKIEERANQAISNILSNDPAVVKSSDNVNFKYGKAGKGYNVSDDTVLERLNTLKMLSDWANPRIDIKSMDPKYRNIGKLKPEDTMPVVFWHAVAEVAGGIKADDEEREERFDKVFGKVAAATTSYIKTDKDSRTRETYNNLLDPDKVAKAFEKSTPIELVALMNTVEGDFKELLQTVVQGVAASRGKFTDKISDSVINKAILDPNSKLPINPQKFADAKKKFAEDKNGKNALDSEQIKGTGKKGAKVNFSLSDLERITGLKKNEVANIISTYLPEDRIRDYANAFPSNAEAFVNRDVLAAKLGMSTGLANTVTFAGRDVNEAFSNLVDSLEGRFKS